MESQADITPKIQLERKAQSIQKRKLIHSLLDIDFSLKSKETAGKIIELYTIFLLLIYPLFLLNDKSMGMSVKMLLFYAITISVLFAVILLSMEKHFTFRRPENLLDYTIASVAGLNLLMIPVKLLQGRGDYVQNLLAVALAVSFYVLSCGFVFYHYYMDLFLFSGAAVLIQLLVHYTIQPAYTKPIALLLEDSHALVCFLLLLAFAAGAEYVNGKQKDNDLFYLMIAGVSMFILFVSQSRTGFLIGLLGATILPLLFPYTAEQVKRGAVFLFLYLFLYSNMSLIAGYSGILRTEVHFPLMDSVYLDLLMAITGVVFFSWWDKLKLQEPLEQVELPIAGTIWRTSAMAEVLLFIGVIFGGKRLSEFGSDFGRCMGEFGMAVLGELSGGRSALLESIEQTGIVGLFLAAALWIFLLERAWKRKREGAEPVRIMAVFLVLLCSLFLSMKETVTPLFLVFCAYALYGKEERSLLPSYSKSRKQPALSIQAGGDYENTLDRKTEE